MDELIKILKIKGASVIGYADLSVLDEEVRHNFPTGISIGIALDKNIIANIFDGPTKEYELEYIRVNSLLEGLTTFTASYLKKQGIDAVTKAPTGSKFSENYMTILPHKTVATLAGLGWIGKCALLITEQFGSAIRFATVLTTAVLPYATPIIESQCEDCVKCVEICPGNAPLGKNWTQGMSRESIYDVDACYQTINKWRSERGINQFICGMCINVCPWTQGYIHRKT